MPSVHSPSRRDDDDQAVLDERQLNVSVGARRCKIKERLADRGTLGNRFDVGAGKEAGVAVADALPPLGRYFVLDSNNITLAKREFAFAIVGRVVPDGDDKLGEWLARTRGARSLDSSGRCCCCWSAAIAGRERRHQRSGESGIGERTRDERRRTGLGGGGEIGSTRAVSSSSSKTFPRQKATQRQATTTDDVDNGTSRDERGRRGRRGRRGLFGRWSVELFGTEFGEKFDKLFCRCNVKARRISNFLF
jgi:hypothetical protein